MIAMVSGSLILKVEPLAHFRGDFNFAAQLVDIALHHIHADAATGNRGDLLGGREARRKDQRERFLAVERGSQCE